MEKKKNIAEVLSQLVQSVSSPQARPSAPPNVKMRTLGGKQFWADKLVWHDWRIQQNVVTGHHRLLDEKNNRLSWGSFETCRKDLDKFAGERKLPEMQGPVVIVLHGLFRNRSNMNRIAESLRKNKQFTVITMGYASTRVELKEHAESLASVIAHLGPKVNEINFVAHSLGNLVIRYYLKMQEKRHGKQRTTPRLGRIVMLGAPNLGSELAKKIIRLDWSGQIVGPVGTQLSSDWQKLEKELATPECQFGIIAGGRGTNRGTNPLLPGDDDWVVSVASTRLPGAHDFRLLKVIHTTMKDDKRVQEMTLRFLEYGYFESEKSRQPIPLK